MPDFQLVSAYEPAGDQPAAIEALVRGVRDDKPHQPLLGGPGPLRGGGIDWIRLLGSRGSMDLADLAINLGLLTLAITAVRAWWTGQRRTPSRSSAVAAPSGAGADQL